MVLTKRLGLSGRLSLLGAALLTLQAQGCVPDSHDRALSLLIRALDRTGLKNIVAVMEIPDLSQTHGSGPTSMQVVKVVVAVDGRQKMTVLEPLQQSGLIIVEDGRTRQIYNPDTRILTSIPIDDSFDPSLRRRLIVANYRVSMTENVHMVGLDVTRIDVTSKKIAGESTQVYVDPTSLFVLKVVAHVSPGQSAKHFDTRSVTYPPTLDPGTFTITTPQGVTTKPEQTPFPVTSLAEAKRRAGFKPVMPGALPYGFIVHKTYVKQGTDYRSVGFELTDGLAMALVFEFPAKNLPASLKAEMKSPQSEFMRRGDLYIGIFTDLSPSVRKRLLAAYRH